MKTTNVYEFAWLSQFAKERITYPTKGRVRRQLILCFSLFFTASFLTLAAPSLQVKPYALDTIATDLNSPWSMVALPNGSWLITERDGHVVITDHQQKTTRIKLTLEELYVAGQGGLLDIILAPDFETSGDVFVSFAQGQLKANRLAIAKTSFNGKSFTKPEIIYQVATDKATPQHYAGRLLVLPDHTLLISSGDGFDYREQAQVITSQLGKTLRINLDGSIPSDNPFAEHATKAAHAVFTFGHRNTQGLIYDYDGQRIVSHEHGPAGGDELNYLAKGNNYGWPVVTYGKDYSRAKISPFTEYPGMEQPKIDWTPSIAPSGMAYYGSKHSLFSALKHHSLITTLVDRKLYAVNLKDKEFKQSHVFPEISARLRDVVVNQAGEIAVLTDGKNAKLILIRAQ